MAGQLATWGCCVVVVAAVVACKGGDDGNVRRAPEDGKPVAPAPPDAPAPAPAPRYTVHFPAPSKVSDTSVKTVSGPMQQTVEIAELDGTTYMVVTGFSPSGLPPGNGSGALDRVLASFGATATRDVPIKLGELDGREVQFTGTGSGILRTFGTGSWMLQAGVIARGHAVDDQRAKQFLDSLQITR